MKKRRQEPVQKTCFSLDLISSLLLASRDEFRYTDIAEGMVALKKAIPFEMRDNRDRILSSEVEVLVALRDFLDEGLAEGWIEAVTMRYPDRCRKDIPIRVRELLADRPGLKDTLDKILAQIELLSA